MNPSVKAVALAPQFTCKIFTQSSTAVLANILQLPLIVIFVVEVCTEPDAAVFPVLK